MNNEKEPSADNVEAVLQKALSALVQARVYVESQNNAEALMEGFGPSMDRPSDKTLMEIDSTTIQLRLFLYSHFNATGAPPISPSPSSLPPQSQGSEQE